MAVPSLALLFYSRERMNTHDLLAGRISRPHAFKIALTLAATGLLVSGTGFAGDTTAAIAADAKSQSLIAQNSTQNSNGRLGRMPRSLSRAVLRDAAQRSGLPQGQLRIRQITAKTFANPCSFDFGDICTREYNPIEGWEVVVQVRDRDWIYHVNEQGSRIVLDPSVGTTDTNLPSAVRNAVLKDAAQQSGLRPADLQITQATAKTFANSCEFGFGEVCNDIYRPVAGWEVTVQVRNQSWRYHVSQSNLRVVRDPNVGSSNANLPSPIQDAILRDAAQRSGLTSREVRIAQATTKTFGNPCEFNFGEICTREYNPIQGWDVAVQVGRETWTYHASRSDSRIALDPKVNSATADLPPKLENAVLQDAARRSGLSMRDLQIAEVTPKTFGNPCEFEFGEVCTREYRPIQGWEVLVQVQSQLWRYHVNRSGSDIVIDPRFDRRSSWLEGI